MKLDFKKYIISIDFGSSIIKYLIMDVSKDDFKIFALDNKVNFDIHSIIDFLLNEYNININDIEVILLTGGRSSFIDLNKYQNVNIKIIPEFTSASFGALLLSKQDRGIILNLGTGTTYIYSDLNEVKHLGGSAIGGGTIMALAKLLYQIENYDDLINFIKKGNFKNADINIEDISKTNIGDLNASVTASNLGAIINNTKKFNDYDIMSSIVNMVVQNIGLLAKELKVNIEKKYNIKNLPLILIGGLIADEYILKYFDDICSYTNVKYLIPEYSRYAVCIGAYEYYLLKLKNE